MAILARKFSTWRPCQDASSWEDGCASSWCVGGFAPCYMNIPVFHFFPIRVILVIFFFDNYKFPHESGNNRTFLRS